MAFLNTNICHVKTPSYFSNGAGVPGIKPLTFTNIRQDYFCEGMWRSAEVPEVHVFHRTIAMPLEDMLRVAIFLKLIKEILRRDKSRF